MKKFIAFGFILILFSSCSITGRYYIRNYTKSPVTIRIELTNDMSNFESDLFQKNYTEGIKKIKFGLYKKIKKELEIKQLNERKVEIIIPPESTSFIGTGINTRLFGIDSIEIIINGKSKYIKSNDQWNLDSKGLMKYTGHYDIKDE